MKLRLSYVLKSEPGTFGEERESEILVGPREATAEIKRLKREFR